QAEDGIRDGHVTGVQTCLFRSLTPQQLPAFYLDLADPEFKSPLAIFHQRYSTNTQPSWALAQPFRFVAHNGEINTVSGNRRWLKIGRASCRERGWMAVGKGR